MKREKEKSVKRNVERMVKVDIRPGPVTPIQKQAWRRFWQKLISDCKREAKNE